MSHPGHTHAYLQYYDYIMPGTYLYPIEMTAMTPTFCAYIPRLEYMSSFTNTITYVNSPFGTTVSSFDNLTHPQTAFYELCEDDDSYNVPSDDFVVEYVDEHLQLQEATPKCTNCQQNEHIHEDDLELQEEKQDSATRKNTHSEPTCTEKTKKKSDDPESPKRNRAYQTEEGYLVEEPSSEPSEEG